MQALGSSGSARSLARPEQLALRNKRVIVTAPRQYASKLCGLLVDAGARPCWVPTIEITSLPREECEQIDDALSNLCKYSHLAFTSKNGIYAVMERLVDLHQDLDTALSFVKESGIRLCALGADGSVLREMGLEPHVQPKEASTLGLVRELVEIDEANGAKVLCPVPTVRGGLVEPAVIPRFLKALGDAGAESHRVDAYVTQMGVDPEQAISERQMLESGHIDAIIFSSTAEAQGLVHAMGALDVIQTAVEQHNVVLAAHGPYTAAGAGGVLGMEISCISKNFSTFEGVVAALEDTFCK